MLSTEPSRKNLNLNLEYRMSAVLFWIYLGVFSFHGNHQGDVNTNHRPIGIEMQTEQGRYGILSFRNTNFDDSITVYRRLWVDDKTFDLNAIAGVVTGYADNPMPYILPVVTFTSRSISADLSCVPNGDDSINCAINLRWKI